MKTEVKSLWAATEVSISEEKEEESAAQCAEKGGKLEGGTLTAVAMEEEPGTSSHEWSSDPVTSVIRPCITS